MTLAVTSVTLQTFLPAVSSSDTVVFTAQRSRPPVVHNVVCATLGRAITPMLFNFSNEYPSFKLRYTKEA